MECKECGHLYMRHDSYGCVNSACPCMKTIGELTGEYSLPQLPDGVKFTKEGYVKQYSLPPDDLFNALQRVIDGIGTFQGYDLVGNRHLKTMTRPFGRLVADSLSDQFSATNTSEPIEMEIQVNEVKERSGKSSELVFRTQFLMQGYRYASSPVFRRLPKTLKERTLFHLHAGELIRRIDADLESPVSSSTSKTHIHSNADIYHNHVRNNATDYVSTIDYNEKRARYRSFKRKESLVVIGSIVLTVFILLRIIF